MGRRRRAGRVDQGGEEVVSRKYARIEYEWEDPECGTLVITVEDGEVRFYQVNDGNETDCFVIEDLVEAREIAVGIIQAVDMVND